MNVYEQNITLSNSIPFHTYAVLAEMTDLLIFTFFKVSAKLKSSVELDHFSVVLKLHLSEFVVLLKYSCS